MTRGWIVMEVFKMKGFTHLQIKHTVPLNSSGFTGWSRLGSGGWSCASKVLPATIAPLRSHPLLAGAEDDAIPFKCRFSNFSVANRILQPRRSTIASLASGRTMKRCGDGDSYGGSPSSAVAATSLASSPSLESGVSSWLTMASQHSSAVSANSKPADDGLSA